MSDVIDDMGFEEAVKENFIREKVSYSYCAHCVHSTQQGWWALSSIAVLYWVVSGKNGGMEWQNGEIELVTLKKNLCPPLSSQFRLP